MAEHVTDIAFWESSARGQTYVGRCSCRWYGDKHKEPDKARVEINQHLEEVNAHLDRERNDD